MSTIPRFVRLFPALILVFLAACTTLAPQEKEDRAAEKKAVDSSSAALNAARAHVTATDAAIITTRYQINSAQSAVEAAHAAVAHIQVEIDDSTLTAPRDGRVQYLVAHPGEVIGAGGRVLSMVDLTDVYMTFFLPTDVVRRIAIGSEVRIVLDAATEYVIPAQVSFVADVAQFTPKTVETASEREKTDVPCACTASLRSAQEICSPGEDRPARCRLCAK